MPAGSADQKRAKWVASLMPEAEATAYKIGVSPEAVISQAALETGWGRAAIGNNIFGIKAGPGWTGKTQDVPTWEDTNGAAPGGEVQIVDRFRDYPTIADSFADHFSFLEKNTRYRGAGVFARAGDEAYFAALKRAGYATDPAYVAKLTSILGTVKGYTAAMERVVIAAPAGYAVTPSGNVVNPNPANSTIVKDADKGSVAQVATTAVAAATPVLAAAGDLDWRVAAVLGAVVLVGGLVALFYFREIRKTRLDMSRQGIV
ncbi:MAG: glucosaminidase domain-containing protein [Hyphomicrobium sp.]|nr:glucosaminidase domain-containing protein [Hyphomicrobium sp.]